MIPTHRTDDASRPAPLNAALPSVSAVLLTYNCERFVAAAVDSALEQDYAGPLEIILSDDASTDGTFAVLRERVAQFRGPHRIVVSQRSVNTGSKSAHLNEVVPACTGEIIVSFDGDDIAKSSRVRTIVERFRADSRVQAVYSAYTLIDELGQPWGRADVPHPPAGADPAAWFARVDAYAAGSTLAIRRPVVDAFGTLDPVVNEDVVLPFRASLLGRVEFIVEPLVHARRHAASLTANWQQFASLERYRERMQAGIEKAGRARQSRLADLTTASVLMPDQHERWERLRGLVERSIRAAEMTRSLTSASLGDRIRTLLALVRIGAYKRELPQHTFLALMPESYLRYRRYKLGVRETSPAKRRLRNAP